MNIKCFPFFLFVCLFSSSSVFAQSKDSTIQKFRTIGISTQIYPAGIIPSIDFNQMIGKKSTIHLRLGGNFANRKDFSPYNDHEYGNGAGGSIGYRRYFKLKPCFVFCAINSDVWAMTIHWENNLGQPNETKGKTNILILQPWLELGAQYWFKITPISLTLSTGFGREFNAITHGKPVAQGFINSLLLQIAYSF